MTNGGGERRVSAFALSLETYEASLGFHELADGSRSHSKGSTFIHVQCYQNTGSPGILV